MLFSDGAERRGNGHPRSAQRGRQTAQQPHPQGPRDADCGERGGDRELNTVAQGAGRETIEKGPCQPAPEQRSGQCQQERLDHDGDYDGTGTEADRPHRGEFAALRIDDGIQRIDSAQRRAERHDRPDEIGDEEQDGIQLFEFVLDHGAFVQGHPSGILPEMLTIQSILGTLHANLPQITQVRFLVDGQQVQTLAGHADLTRVYTVTDTTTQPADPDRAQPEDPDNQ